MPEQVKYERPNYTADAHPQINEQYKDLIRFILQRPDDPFSPYDYLNWDDRDLTIRWHMTEGRGDIKMVQERLYRLTAGAARYAAGTSGRGGASIARLPFFSPLVEAPGAFYRTGDHQRSSLFVLDTAARFRRRGKKVQLDGASLPHLPVHDVIPMMYQPQLGKPEPAVMSDALPTADAAARMANAAALLEAEHADIQRTEEQAARKADEMTQALNGSTPVVSSDPEILVLQSVVGGDIILRRQDGTVIMATITKVVAP